MYGSLTLTDTAAIFGLSSVIIVYNTLSAFIASVGLVDFHHMVSVLFQFFVYMSSDNWKAVSLIPWLSS